MHKVMIKREDSISFLIALLSTIFVSTIFIMVLPEIFTMAILWTFMVANLCGWVSGTYIERRRANKEMEKAQKEVGNDNG